MEFRTPQGQERYDALLATAHEVLVGLDFDGTLSPIVEDPARAVIHPDGPRVLAALAARVRAVEVEPDEHLVRGGQQCVVPLLALRGAELHAAHARAP